MRAAKPRREPGSRPPARDIGAEDEPLWDALRQCRAALADAAGVPPYVIFHDSTLREFARIRPLTARAMLGVHGAGRAKLERYGAEFLAVVGAFPASGKGRPMPSAMRS